MSSTDVSDAWQEAIFEHATVQAMTPIALAYVFTDKSEDEIGTLYHEQQINFFEYLVKQEIIDRIIGSGTGARVRYVVEVRRTIEQDTSGDNYATVGEDLETIIGLVESELASTWSDTVDFFTYQDTPIQVDAIRIGSVDCWRGVYKFYGTKEITL